MPITFVMAQPASLVATDGGRCTGKVLPLLWTMVCPHAIGVFWETSRGLRHQTQHASSTQDATRESAHLVVARDVVLLMQ